WFLVGWIVSLVAWVLHVAALSVAALARGPAVLSGGLVFLAVLAERFFGFRLERRQWAGVTITAAGLVIVGLTATPEGPQRSSLAALIAVESAILLFGVGLVRISTRRGIPQRGEALLLATAAGVLFGVSDVALKYLTHAHGPLLGLLSPWTLTALISFVISFYASARSLQVGLAIEVIAITSVAANLAAIIGGILERCRAAAVVLRCAVMPVHTQSRRRRPRNWYRRALPVPQSPINPRNRIARRPQPLPEEVLQIRTQPRVLRAF